jgi:class 3 adenylate cyclase
VEHPGLVAGPVGASTIPATHGGSAGTRAFLFSDLRGYTAFVERAGDRAAAEVLATYRELVRNVIGARDGAEIRTEGDSFYVVFPSASSAVEASLEIVSAANERSTAQRPIRVGVGVHAGETVATTEGLVGGAVNIAARVCSKAQPGEVLVTDTVRALTRTFLPYRYVGLGAQQLKGIAGGIPLYRVEAVPSTRGARLRRQIAGRRGRIGRIGAVVAMAVLLAIAAGTYAATRAPDCLSLPRTARDLVARIEPVRGCVVGTRAVGLRPGPIAAVESGIWLGNLDDHTVTWIDPALSEAVTSGAFGTPVAVAPGGGGGAYVLLRDDRTVVGQPASSGFTRDRVAWYDRHGGLREVRALPPVEIGTISAYDSIAFADGLAWISEGREGRIVLVNFGSGLPPAVEVETPPRSGLGPIDAGAGATWVASRLEPVVYRLQGATAPPRPIQLPDEHGGVAAIDATDAAVWLARADGTLTRLDPETEARESIEIDGTHVSQVAVGADGVWVVDPQSGHVRRVDPSTRRADPPIDVGGRPAGIALGPDGSPWVTIQGR